MKLTKGFREDFGKILLKFKDAYGWEAYEKLLALNGISNRQLDYSEFIDHFVDSDNVANSSIDSNANVKNKDIVSLLNEMSKPQQKIIGMNKIHYELCKKSRKLAFNWLENELLGRSYLHDAYSSTFVSYCYAYSLKDVAERGLFFIDSFGAKPPKHLDTFVDFVAEFISYNCNRTSGAVGLPDFLIYAYYFWENDKENVIDPDKYLRQQFQRFIYRCNQPFLRSGTQSAFVNTSLFDREYFIGLFGGQTFPDNTHMINCMEEFMDFQLVFLDVMSEIKNENIFAFPVNTISLCKKDGKFLDEDFAKKAVKRNMQWSDSNFYVSDSVDTLSNCCRLQSNVRDLYFNSIGGTALSVGSVKVDTVNLACIAYQFDREDYLSELRKRVKINLECLDTVRHIIKRNIEKGLLPNYSNGLIDLNTQYNTIGVNGLYEALKFYGLINYDDVGFAYYSNEGLRFAVKIFETIHDEIDKFKEKHDYMINVEEIPGENCSKILQAKDKIIFGSSVIDELPLYGNQFIPLGVKATLVERVRVSEVLDKACNGGSILHVNIDKPFTEFNHCWKLFDSITNRVSYFAFNTVLNQCENHHTFYENTCPVCGGEVKEKFTRVVGFMTSINSWSKERREEFDLRNWYEVY